MTEPKRVFCKDCKNFLGGSVDIIINSEWRRHIGERCKIATIEVDIVQGEMPVPSDALVLNARFDCPHFTPPGGERIGPGNAKPVSKPWWRFW